MGICAPPRTREDKFIDFKLDEESCMARSKVNLLLLGTGNAGKSTFFRQFKLQYGDGITYPEREIYRMQIQEQCVFYMGRLVTECLKRHDTEEEYSTIVDTTYQMMRTDWSFKPSNEPYLSEKYAEQIEHLWQDKHVRLAYNDETIRSAICVPLSCATFWDDIYRVASHTFLPTDEDCIQVYNRTSGITSLDYEYENSAFSIVDIGGQRSERRKWIHVFDGADSLLYVFSLSAYDEVLFEDCKTNAMTEQLRVFEETVNSAAFDNTNIIVFLNKSDLLQEKIDSGRPISSYFEDFDGDASSFRSSVSFFRNKLRALDQNPNRKLYFHTTCATSTENARKVLADVTQMVVRKELASGGFM